MSYFAKIALIGSLLVSSVSYAGLQGPTGAGEATCSKYLAVRTTPIHEDIYVQWVSGMITGIVSQTSRVSIANLTLAGIATALKDYCSTNPSETIFVAAGNIAKPYLVARPYTIEREASAAHNGT